MKDLDRYIHGLKTKGVGACPASLEAHVLRRVSRDLEASYRIPAFMSLKGAFIAAIVLFAMTGSIVSLISLNSAETHTVAQVSRELGFDALQRTELVSLN